MKKAENGVKKTASELDAQDSYAFENLSNIYSAFPIFKILSKRILLLNFSLLRMGLFLVPLSFIGDK